MNLNPLNAKTLEDLERMERDAAEMYRQTQQLENIPYTNRRLSSAQLEISDEMSQYGSTLVPALIGCGVATCIGVSCKFIDKCCTKQPKIKKEPPANYRPKIRHTNKSETTQEREYITISDDEDEITIPQTPSK